MKRIARLALVVFMPWPLLAQEPPPQILQIYRERLKPGAEAAYGRIEEEIARTCARLKCPHAYLALESVAEPKEVWWLNAYTSEADRDRVGRAWDEHAAVTAALRRIAPRKKGLTDEPVNVFAAFRSDLSAASCWRMAGTRFFTIVMTSADGNVDGCVFMVPDGTRFAFTPAATRADASRQAAAAGADGKVFAVRPSWSVPEEAWVAADPGFWRTNTPAKRRRARPGLPSTAPRGALASSVRAHPVRAHRLLPARRVDQQSVHASVAGGLKRNPKGELRDEEVPQVFRTQT